MDYLPISLIGCISKILAEVPATGDRTAIGVFNFQVYFFFFFVFFMRAFLHRKQILWGSNCKCASELKVQGEETWIDL